MPLLAQQGLGCNQAARDMNKGTNAPTARLAKRNVRRLLDHDQIFNPRVNYEAGVETPDGPGAKLYLETFVRSAKDKNKWDSAPSDSWPLIASFTPRCVRMYPIFANPHAQRYLRRQHGVFTSVVYEDDCGEEPPADSRSALRQIEFRLPFGIFTDYYAGFGLEKELTEVVRTIGLLGKDRALKIVKKGESRMEPGEVVVSAADMDSLRKAMNRIDRRKRDGVRHAKNVTVFNELLTKLDPEHFGRSDVVQAQEPAALMSPARTRRVNTLRRQAGETAASQLRANLHVLAAQKPAVLMELQAEIERVTLSEMIDRFELLLGQDLPEGDWQSFFETYQFVLALAFARPVQLLHTQFRAQTSAMDGAGAQIGDFLLRQTGRGLAIVEIKKPGTELLSGTAYRNTQVFAPSRELSGAVTQTLIQQNALRVEWSQHFLKDPKLRHSSPEAIRCVIVAGRSLTDVHQLASFEVFRNACKDVEVLTYDELLEKLKYIREQLNPPSPPSRVLAATEAEDLF